MSEKDNSRNECWKSLFVAIAKLDQDVFARFVISDGGGGYRFLPGAECFFGDRYQTATDSFRYSEIFSLEIPEQFTLKSFSVLNDLNAIVNVTKKHHGFVVQKIEDYFDPCVKGDVLEIKYHY